MCPPGSAGFNELASASLYKTGRGENMLLDGIDCLPRTSPWLRVIFDLPSEPVGDVAAQRSGLLASGHGLTISPFNNHLVADPSRTPGPSTDLCANGGESQATDYNDF